MARADRNTTSRKQIEYYSDFPIEFNLNPVTGLLARLTNEESIKQRLKNLILTNLTERPYQPLVGSKIRASLFDLNDGLIEDSIQNSIKVAIENYEPSAKIINIFVKSNNDTNSVDVRIVFETINIPNKQFDLFLIINRVR